MGIFCATERRPFTGDGAGEEANTQQRRVGVRGARAQHLLHETGLQRRKGEQQKPQNETQTEQHNKHTHTHTHKHSHRHARKRNKSKHAHTHTNTHTHIQSASAPHARDLPKYFRKSACTNSWGDPPGKHKAYTHVKAKHRAAAEAPDAKAQAPNKGKTPPGPIIYTKAGATEQRTAQAPNKERHRPAK